MPCVTSVARYYGQMAGQSRSTLTTGKSCLMTQRMTKGPESLKLNDLVIHRLCNTMRNLGCLNGSRKLHLPYPGNQGGTTESIFHIESLVRLPPDHTDRTVLGQTHSRTCQTLYARKHIEIERL